MMKRLALVGALAVAGSMLSGCVDDYSYGGMAVGYGYPGYGYGPGDYYSDYYAGAYGSSYWGWYDGFYYPGFGGLVYDGYRRPYRWNGAQQRYWTGRLNGWQGERPRGPQWGGFGDPREQGSAGRNRYFGTGQPGAAQGGGGRGHPGQGVQGSRAPASVAGGGRRAARSR